MSDLSPVIETFLTGTYTVTRKNPATVGSDGYADAGSSSTFDIRASVQPATGRDLKTLPEGMRTDEALSVWTSTELKTQGSGQDPDTVSIDGDTYEVAKVERWNALGNYFKALVAKVGR